MHVSRHSSHTTLCISFFLHFLRLPATFSLGYVSRHIQPTFLAVFFRIRFIYCRLDDCRLDDCRLTKLCSIIQPHSVVLSCMYVWCAWWNLIRWCLYVSGGTPFMVCGYWTTAYFHNFCGFMFVFLVFWRRKCVDQLTKLKYSWVNQWNFCQFLECQAPLTCTNAKPS